jgi:Suppressor of fused protein (SUFU)
MTTPTDIDLLAALTEALDEPDHTDADPKPGADGITIHAFSRNFVDDDDDDAEDDMGYVLVTCGMSRQRMVPMPEATDDDDQGQDSRSIELIWYVKTLDPAYFAALRWLAKLPQLDKIAYFHGRTISNPSAPLTVSPFKTYLLLPPIYGPDADLFEGLEASEGDEIGALVVHLISDAEAHLIKSKPEGLDDFLDLLDDKDYPMLFDPGRRSYV